MNRFLTAIIALALSTACLQVEQDGTVGSDLTQIQVGDSFVPTGLVPVSSCTELENMVARSFIRTRGLDRWFAFDGMLEDSVSAIDGAQEISSELASDDSAESAESAGSSDRGFSETNVQVAGVDEADVVDGVGDLLVYQRFNAIWSYDADTNEAVELVGGGDDFGAGIYGIDDTTFVAIWLVDQAFGYGYENPEVLVETYGLVNGVARKQSERRFAGVYISSRRVDNQIYLTLDSGFNEWLDFSDVYERYYRIVKAAEDAEIQTGFGLTTTQVESLVDLAKKAIDFDTQAEWLGNDCRDVLVPNTDHIDLSMVHLVSMDVDKDLASQARLTIAGSGNVMYQNFTSIALAGWGRWLSENESLQTPVFMFDAENGDIAYRAAGQVSGYVSSQFALHEANDVMYVASSVWQDFNNFTKLSSFNSQDGSAIGESVDLAKNETMRSVRFIGDRAYIVTFRQVDPLFVLDIADPKQLTLLGELKIPGFSSYIHPLDDDKLLTVGFDGDDERLNGNIAIRTFNVKDPTTPKSVDLISIGDDKPSFDNYVDSPAMYDHHAFAFDNDQRLLAMPYESVTYSYDETSDTDVLASNVMGIRVGQDGSLTTEFDTPVGSVECWYYWESEDDDYYGCSETGVSGMERIVFEGGNDGIVAAGVGGFARIDGDGEVEQFTQIDLLENLEIYYAPQLKHKK